MFTALKRVFTGGGKNFVRTGAVSFATVLIMTVTLMIVGFLIFLSALLTYTLQQLQDKVDVTVYFTTNASEGQVLNLRDKLNGNPEVAAVEYTSADQALADFKNRHTNDTLTLNALNELGSNPLGPSLDIKAHDPSEYPDIVTFVNNDQDLTVNGASIVDHINYYQNKTVIDRLTSTIHTLEQAGLVIVIIFAIASTIIALATVRLAIYSARDEIAVMRLVGASNGYIRGPFIVAGLISGFVSGVIAMLIYTPVAWYLGSNYSSWFGGFNFLTYYLSHFFIIVGIVVGSGILLGGFASYLAVRRYLRV